jgi:hypothetical protein
MAAIKSAITSIVGISCTLLGTWLRLAAHVLAWPTEWTYRGPREDIIWAIREHAYQDLSLVILGFGLLVIIIGLMNWLWSPTLHGNISDDRIRSAQG